MKSLLSSFIKKLKIDKRVLVIVIVGFIGIFLLTLSEILPNGDEKESPKDDTQVQSISEYEENLEERLAALISEIDGAGETSVMLTLDCGDENVYASENKTSDTASEKEYVLIENEGNETGLLLKVSQPEVRGVAVVCSGADSAKVREEITGVITAVLGISTNRVNIAKMKTVKGG